jgi:hypothetical protein
MNIEEIRNNPDEVDWEEISFSQKLSEDFIREFQDKVDWALISAKLDVGRSISSGVANLLNKGVEPQ